MLRRLSLALLAAATLAASVGAQSTTPPIPPGAPPSPARTVPVFAQAPAPPAPPASTAPPARAVPTQNVRVDVVITDTFGTAPVKKTLTLLLLDGRRGSVRSSQSIPMDMGGGKVNFTSIGINLDATPSIRPDGRIELSLSVGYTPNRPDIAPGANAGQTPAEINESLWTLLLDGKSTLLSQSADPQSDRKVTLEVTATVVR